MLPSELLAHRLAAVPTAQLEALRKAVEAAMPRAAPLMLWLRELVDWEMARRRALPSAAVAPDVARLDVGEASLTLAALAAVFRTSIAKGVVELRPTVELLEGVREALLGYASGRNEALH